MGGRLASESVADFKRNMQCKFRPISKEGGRRNGDKKTMDVCSTESINQKRSEIVARSPFVDRTIQSHATSIMAFTTAPRLSPAPRKSVLMPIIFCSGDFLAQKYRNCFTRHRGKQKKGKSKKGDLRGFFLNQQHCR
jgi:hypothetical protein